MLGCWLQYYACTHAQVEQCVKGQRSHTATAVTPSHTDCHFSQVCMALHLLPVQEVCPKAYTQLLHYLLKPIASSKQKSSPAILRKKVQKWIMALTTWCLNWHLFSYREHSYEKGYHTKHLYIQRYASQLQICIVAIIQFCSLDTSNSNLPIYCMWGMSVLHL